VSPPCSLVATFPETHQPRCLHGPYATGSLIVKLLLAMSQPVPINRNGHARHTRVFGRDRETCGLLSNLPSVAGEVTSGDGHSVDCIPTYCVGRAEGRPRRPLTRCSHFGLRKGADYSTDPLAATLASICCAKAGTLRSAAVAATCRDGHGGLDQSRRRGEPDARLGVCHLDDPVSTSTVATAKAPRPHIGSRPDTSTNSTPQSVAGADSRLQKCAGHRRVTARLAHQRLTAIVEVHLEAQPPLLHRVAGQRPS
jgi:hypothetical protein